MGFVRDILRNSFDRPKGRLIGGVGGAILARTNRACAARVVGLLDIQSRDRVLEIGFGPGVGLEFLASAAPSATIAGVDVSNEMLRLAASRNRAAIDGGRMTLRLASAEGLPFPRQSFDKAFSINSLHIWSEPAVGLREVLRVLRPGGRIAFAFSPQSGQGKEGVVQRFAEAGFSEIRIVDGEAGFCVLASKAADRLFWSRRDPSGAWM